jgi:hypothetical protein
MNETRIERATNPELSQAREAERKKKERRRLMVKIGRERARAVCDDLYDNESEADYACS